MDVEERGGKKTKKKPIGKSALKENNLIQLNRELVSKKKRARTFYSYTFKKQMEDKILHFPLTYFLKGNTILLFFLFLNQPDMLNEHYC